MERERGEHRQDDHGRADHLGSERQRSGAQGDLHHQVHLRGAGDPGPAGGERGDDYAGDGDGERRGAGSGGGIQVHAGGADGGAAGVLRKLVRGLPGQHGRGHGGGELRPVRRVQRLRPELCRGLPVPAGAGEGQGRQSAGAGRRERRDL